MNNLQSIITIAAALSIPVSIWAVIYFGSKIILQKRIRRDLGDMPSAEQLHAWYEQNNSIITYGQHSPTPPKERA